MSASSYKMQGNNGLINSKKSCGRMKSIGTELFTNITNWHLMKQASSVADLGSGPFLTPGSGMGKNPGLGTRDEHSGSYFLRT
jgi:hypothetical protein